MLKQHGGRSTGVGNGGKHSRGEGGYIIDLTNKRYLVYLLISDIIGLAGSRWVAPSGSRPASTNARQ